MNKAQLKFQQEKSGGTIPVAPGKVLPPSPKELFRSETKELADHPAFDIKGDQDALAARVSDLENRVGAIEKNMADHAADAVAIAEGKHV
jgi:hypothetical protein